MKSCVTLCIFLATVLVFACVAAALVRNAEEEAQEAKAWAEAIENEAAEMLARVERDNKRKKEVANENDRLVRDDQGNQRGLGPVP